MKSASDTLSRRSLLTAACAAAGMTLVPSLALASFRLSGTAWSRAAADAGVDPHSLYAIALIESSRGAEGWVTPQPHAIRTPRRSLYPQNYHAAERALAEIPDDILPSCDLGLMQINVRWHGARVRKPAEFLDPFTNLTIGASILAEAIASAPGDPILGHGRYHNWTDQPRARGYGRAIVSLAQGLRRAETQP